MPLLVQYVKLLTITELFTSGDLRLSCRLLLRVLRSNNVFYLTKVKDQKDKGRFQCRIREFELKSQVI